MSILLSLSARYGFYFGSFVDGERKYVPYVVKCLVLVFCCHARKCANVIQEMGVKKEIDICLKISKNL